MDAAAAAIPADTVAAAADEVVADDASVVADTNDVAAQAGSGSELWDALDDFDIHAASPKYRTVALRAAAAAAAAAAALPQWAAVWLRSLRGGGSCGRLTDLERIFTTRCDQIAATLSW